MRAMLRPTTRRSGLRVLLALACLIVAFTAAEAAELVMFRRDGCSWCARWDREIGTIYAKTDLGRRAPLRMVDLDRDKPGVRVRSRVVYTPTFVLAEKGQELGRIEGYPGDEFFWGLLERLLELAPRPRPLSAIGNSHRGERDRFL
jgi:hypothetical protein